MKNSMATAQFNDMFSESKSLRAGDLLFKYKKDLNPKLGLIVSKKYGNAVNRNLFKRRCRTKFHQLVKSGNLKHSIIVLPKTEKINWTKIDISFMKLSEKLND